MNVMISKVSCQYRVQSVCVDPSESVLIASGNGYISRYLIPSLKETHINSIQGFVSSSIFSSDGSYVFVGLYHIDGSENRIVKFLSPDLSQISIYSNHTKSITCLQFHRKIGVLISGSKDCTMTLWNPKTDIMIAQLRGHKDSVQAIAISNSQLFFVSGGSDKNIIFWSFTSEKAESGFTCQEPISSMIVSSNDESVVVGGQYTIFVYEIMTWKNLKTYQSFNETLLKQILSLTHGDGFITRWSDGSIKLFKNNSEPILIEGLQKTAICLLSSNHIASSDNQQQLSIESLNVSLYKFDFQNNSFTDQINRMYDEFGEVEFIQGSFKNFKKNGKSLIIGSNRIESNHSIKSSKLINNNFVVKNIISRNGEKYRIEKYDFENKFKILGTSTQEIKTFDGEFSVSEIRKGLTKIFVFENEYYSSKDLYVRGKLEFSNGNIDGWIHNGNFVFDSRNENSFLNFGDEKLSIFALRSDGKIVTSNGRVFELKLESAEIIEIGFSS